MVVVRILDEVAQASSYEDGKVIYDLIAPHVASGDPVTVSFAGLHAVPSAFINAALIRLVEVAPIAQVRNNLRIIDSTKFINDLIRDRFKFVEISPRASRAAQH
jgi:hypothetical protein